MVDAIYQEARNNMEKAIDSLLQEFQNLAFERANPSLLENLKVDVYGQKMPLKGISNVTKIDNRTLSINVWDKNNVSIVDKSIRTSNLNLNPKIDGNKLLIILPNLTTEKKKELTKIAKAKAETTKISIRNSRRVANDSLKKLNKDSELSEDELEKELKKFQNLTDEKVKKIEEILRNKEKNLLEV